MPVYTCKRCHKVYKNYSDLQHIDSILANGICCDCREDAAYCTKCNHYYFNEEAYIIIKNESELCLEHYQEFVDNIYSSYLRQNSKKMRDCV